jgi:hypothetical protein
MVIEQSSGPALGHLKAAHGSVVLAPCPICPGDRERNAQE